MSEFQNIWIFITFHKNGSWRGWREEMKAKVPCHSILIFLIYFVATPINVCSKWSTTLTWDHRAVWSAIWCFICVSVSIHPSLCLRKILAWHLMRKPPPIRWHKWQHTEKPLQLGQIRGERAFPQTEGSYTKSEFSRSMSTLWIGARTWMGTNRINAAMEECAPNYQWSAFLLSGLTGVPCPSSNIATYIMGGNNIRGRLPGHG